MRRYVFYIQPLAKRFVPTFALQFRLYLEENGFDTSQMGTQSEVSSDYPNDEKGDLKATA